MKLQCNVELGNRISATNIIRRKSQRSTLAIGKKSIKNPEFQILWQTFQNKQGTSYKIDNNISQVFKKFINEGKATIRFLKPPHDLIIQADIIELKSFVRLVQLAIFKELDPSVRYLPILKHICMNSIAKTKITINKPSEYPVLEGFPRTTEELHLAGLGRKSFDRQILKLQSLRILNLSNNKISSLPKELGALQHLQELILSQNRLNKAIKWGWLDETAMKFNLKLLDISNNMLDKLPEQIGKLGALVNLKASQNELSYLPQSIGKLFNLRYLDVSKNNLHCLPGSMRNLRLVALDVSHNEFRNLTFDVNVQSDVISLTEYAARSFLKTRCPYDASIIPYTLVKYLDNAKYCICGEACFQYYARKFVDYSLNAIASNIKSSGNDTVSIDCYFCSMKCTNSVNPRSRAAVVVHRQSRAVIAQYGPWVFSRNLNR